MLNRFFMLFNSQDITDNNNSDNIESLQDIMNGPSLL